MDIDDSRAALRARQGKGARYDNPAAPADELALARLGTAYFARKLNELPDVALDGAALVPGWSRRHVVAHVGFQARALARLVEAAREGRTEEALSEPEAQNEDVDFGATLPAHALRHLFDHSKVHLDVEWRDLGAQGWRARVHALTGSPVQIADTPWLRAREIWMRAVDLDNGGSLLDFPPGLIDRLLAELAADLPHALHPLDRDAMLGAPRGSVVRGRAADLLRWITGRGARRLEFPDGPLPEPPFWPACGREGRA